MLQFDYMILLCLKYLLFHNYKFIMWRFCFLRDLSIICFYNNMKPVCCLVGICSCWTVFFLSPVTMERIFGEFHSLHLKFQSSIALQITRSYMLQNYNNIFNRWSWQILVWRWTNSKIQKIFRSIISTCKMFWRWIHSTYIIKCGFYSSIVAITYRQSVKFDIYNLDFGLYT